MSKIIEFLNLVCRDKYINENKNILLVFLEKYEKYFENISENKLKLLAKKFINLYQVFGKDFSRVLDEFAKEIEKNDSLEFYINLNIENDLRNLIDKIKKREKFATDKRIFKNTYTLLINIYNSFLKEENIMKKEILLRKIETLITSLFLQTISKEKKEKLKKYLLKYLEDYPWDKKKKQETLKAFIKKFVLKELKFPYPRISLYGSLYKFHKE